MHRSDGPGRQGSQYLLKVLSARQAGAESAALQDKTGAEHDKVKATPGR